MRHAETTSNKITPLHMTSIARLASSVRRTANLVAIPIVIPTTIFTTIFTTIRAALICGSLAIGITACTSSKTPPAPLADYKPSASISQQWAITTGNLNAAPTILGEGSNARIMIASDNQVSAHQAVTGALAWRTQVGLVQAPVGISADGTKVLVLVQGAEAIALDANTGVVSWRSALPAEMRSQAASVGGLFVVLTTDGRIVGLDQATGRRRWALARTVPALSVRGSGAVAALTNNIAAVGLPGGKAIGINVASGQIIWEANIAQPRGVNEVERIADVLPHWVSVAGLGLCATSYHQRAACVDDRGQITHAQDMLAASGLVVSGSQWFAIEAEGNVKSWTLKKASPNAGQAPIDWTFEGLQGRMSNNYQALSALGSAVFAHDSTGHLHMLSVINGKTIARVNTGLSAHVSLVPLRIDGKDWLLAAAGQTVQAWQAVQ